MTPTPPPAAGTGQHPVGTEPPQAGTGQPPAQPPAQSPPPGKTYTQAELDAELGKLKDQYKDFEAIKTKLEAFEDATLSDTQKTAKALKDAEDKALEASRGKAEADIKLLKTVKLLAAGADQTKLSDLINLLQGSTEAEIDKNIATLKAFGAFQAPGTGAGGTGQHPAPPTTPPAKKIWKSSEIAKMSREDHIKNKDEIIAAMNEGRITSD